MRTFYSSVRISILTLSTFLIGSSIHGQNDKSRSSHFRHSFSLSSDPYSIISNALPNLCIGYNIERQKCGGIIRQSKYGIQVEGSYVAYIEELPSFTNQFQYYSFSVSARFFPLHNFFSQNLKKSRSSRISPLPCPSWSAKKEYRLYHDLFLSPGYRKEKSFYNYLPIEELESPVAEIPFHVDNQGLQLELGYQLGFNRVFVEGGYSWFIGFPKVGGMIDPFHDSIYTATFPIKYSLKQQLHFRIGINF